MRQVGKLAGLSRLSGVNRDRRHVTLGKEFYHCVSLVIVLISVLLNLEPQVNDCGVNLVGGDVTFYFLFGLRIRSLYHPSSGVGIRVKGLYRSPPAFTGGVVVFNNECSDSVRQILSPICRLVRPACVGRMWF